MILHFSLVNVGSHLALQHYKSEIQSRTVLLFCVFANAGSYLRKEGLRLDLETSASSHGKSSRSARLGRLACLPVTFRLIRLS